MLLKQETTAMHINQSTSAPYNADKTAFGARLFKTNSAVNLINEMGSGFKANIDEFHAPYIEQITCSNLPVNVIIDVAKTKFLGILSIGKKFIIKTQLQDAPQVQHIATLDIPKVFFGKNKLDKYHNESKAFANNFFEKLNWSASYGLPESPEYISSIESLKAEAAISKRPRRSVKKV